MFDFEELDFEFVWIFVCFYWLFRCVLCILVGVVYYFLFNGDMNECLVGYIDRNCEIFLLKYFDGVIIVIGDFNLISIGLKFSYVIYKIGFM